MKQSLATFKCKKLPGQDEIATALDNIMYKGRVIIEIENPATVKNDNWYITMMIEVDLAENDEFVSEEHFEWMAHDIWSGGDGWALIEVQDYKKEKN